MANKNYMNFKNSINNDFIISIEIIQIKKKYYSIQGLD